MSERKTFDAYYYSFDATGNEHIDAILDAVARAGRAYHHTDGWRDEAYGDGTPVEWIQDAANKAAEAWNQAKR